MPVPYNRDFTRYKSTQLASLDCTPAGSVVAAGHEGPPFVGTFVSNEILEQGDCVAMVRVPKNFVVTVVNFFTAKGNTAVVGVGDPFCCGRFIGPIDTSLGPTDYVGQAQNQTCGTAVWWLQKMGRGGDGCGYGYMYSCATDIIITNGYGNSTFQQGGGSVSGTAMSSGGTPGTLASGTVLGLYVDGYVHPTGGNLS